ncbi:TRAP transporter small permease [Chelativorans salis]|uniref:TRAP transporter small permease protein n=1 Tax=Chelativorans salis TaxID=2978478 RepID=A0ABT2LUK4_9HYPH|nr:TRAP transporter small permease [Chelativorans sp. EGI FJ00035]MCT7377058.1 TRAP transporter small permease [Chelativorans sp. EGI FJ00035]
MPTAARAIRRSLDAVYDGAGALAALCLLAILIVISAQVVARWTGVPFPGSSQYAGYLMAAASFLAFAHTLNRGAHIRVNLFLTALGQRRFWGELWCLVIASAASTYLAWFAVRAVYWSWRLGDVSQGQDATPLWIAQTPMAVGAVILAVCFIDNLVTLLLAGRDNIRPDLSQQSRAE